jgi:coniferyl-aldehyde dehydrogenase
MSETTDQENLTQSMLNVLNRQKKAYIKEGVVTAEVRIDRLARTIDLLGKYGTRLCETMASDFGHRSIQQSN